MCRHPGAECSIVAWQSTWAGISSDLRFNYLDVTGSPPAVMFVRDRRIGVIRSGVLVGKDANRTIR